jgi:chromosome segregation ATPase
VEEEAPPQKLVKENQDLRRDIEKVKVENKGLKKRLKAEESSKEQVKVLKELVKELESKCSELQNDLDSTSQDLDLKDNQCSSLPTDNARMEVMVRKLKAPADALANNQVKLDAAVRELDEYKQKCEELLPLKKTEARLTGASDKLEFYKRKCGQLEQQVEDLNGRPHIKKLHNEIADLKKSPLLQIRAAVRMRFLDQANKSTVKAPKIRTNKVIIERGSDAAHRADGKADAALFHAGILSIPEDASAFEEVYGVAVDFYLAQPARWQRVLDLHTTAYTRKSDSASLEKVNDLAQKLRTFGFGIEESDEAEDLLAALKEEVDFIVQDDRWGNSSRNFYTTNVSSFLPPILFKHADPEPGKLC